MNDHLCERLPGAPVIADADFLRINVWMEYRGGHAAKRRPAGIIQRQEHLGLMRGARHKGIVSIWRQTLYLHRKNIFLRGRALGVDELDKGMIFKNPLDEFMVGIQAAQSDIHGGKKAIYE